MTPPPIEARCLEKSFAFSTVLRAVNLKVDRGEGGLIVGRNGSGKSTLVRVLSGLSSPSSGQALLFGEPARKLQPHNRRRVGVLTHQTFLYSRLTARENLEFYSQLFRVEHNRAGIDALL